MRDMSAVERPRFFGGPASFILAAIALVACDDGAGSTPSAAAPEAPPTAVTSAPMEPPGPPAPAIAEASRLIAQQKIAEARAVITAYLQTSSCWRSRITRNDNTNGPARTSSAPSNWRPTIT